VVPHGHHSNTQNTCFTFNRTHLSRLSAALLQVKDAIFEKGQSKRIWGELYKVLDSSDVVIQVLDARDPMGTRCKFIEQHIRKNSRHKHLLLLLNKCDLVSALSLSRLTTIILGSLCGVVCVDGRMLVFCAGVESAVDRRVIAVCAV
jgi:hypothetical protein